MVSVTTRKKLATSDPDAEYELQQLEKIKVKTTTTTTMLCFLGSVLSLISMNFLVLEFCMVSLIFVLSILEEIISSYLEVLRIFI